VTNILTRIRHAWAVLMGRTQRIETDAEAELRQLHARVVFALRYIKDLPMAISADITALGDAINAALAAKDATVAPLQAQITDLNTQVSALTTELAAADAQVVALTASIAPHA